jgi:hypothetical protein
MVAAEHALDFVAVTIGALVIGKRLAAIGLVGNDRGGAVPRSRLGESAKGGPWDQSPHGFLSCTSACAKCLVLAPFFNLC